MTPQQLARSIGGHAAAAVVDTTARAASGQRGLVAKFRSQVVAAAPHLSPAEVERRADSLYMAHMLRLSLASAKARQRKAAAA